jgi:hypothetical protein
MHGRLAALGLCSGLVLGFSSCAPAPRITTARVTLQQLPSCELPAGPRLSLRATGDFPMERRDLAKGAEVSLDGLPRSAAWLALEADQGQTRAGGLVPLVAGQDLDRSVLMLPLDRSCPLGDPLARAPSGAAVAGLADGSLLIAGGQDDSGAASSSALILPAGGALVQQVPGGMLLRRADASATRVGANVVVVGGGQDALGSAQNTFEIYDSASGRFAPARRLASGPRRGHGAVALADGRVLIVGGQTTASGAALDSAELIDVAKGSTRALDSVLQVPRVAPRLLALDSGAVLIALGRSDGADPISPPSGVLERFDAKRERFSSVSTMTSLPTHPESAVTALEGDRALYLGCEPGDAGCELALVLPRGDDFDAVVLDAELGPEALAAAGVRDLEQIRLLALRDGTVLVTGRERAQAIARQAFVIDLGLRSITALPDAVSRVPEQLAMLEDGTIAELDALGASLGRHDLQSDLDDPPTPVVGSAALHVALDDPGRWEPFAGGPLVAKQAPARFDLPFLRFADLRVEIALDGAAQLLLEPAGSAPLSIALGAHALAFGACSLARQGDAITVERHGDSLTLHSGARTATCSSGSAIGRVGVALRAEPGASVRSLRVTRL